MKNLFSWPATRANHFGLWRLYRKLLAQTPTAVSAIDIRCTRHVRRGEHQYVAECVELAVVTQGKTVDETLENLKKAVALHLEGEDPVKGGCYSVTYPSRALAFLQGIAFPSLTSWIPRRRLAAASSSLRISRVSTMD